MFDARRITSSDGQATLTTSADRLLEEGDRVIVALVPDEGVPGTYAINSTSAFFLLTDDGKGIVRFDRSNPVADEAQEGSVEDLRGQLTG